MYAGMWAIYFLSLDFVKAMDIKSCNGQQLNAYFVITVPKSSLNTAVSMVRRHLQESGLPTGSGQRVSILYHSSTFDILQMDGYLAYLKLTESLGKILKFLDDLELFHKGQIPDNPDIKFTGKQYSQLNILALILQGGDYNSKHHNLFVYISEGIPTGLLVGNEDYSSRRDVFLRINQNSDGRSEFHCVLANGSHVDLCIILGIPIDKLDVPAKMIVKSSRTFVELLNFREDLIDVDLETRMILRYYDSRVSSPDQLLLLKPEASLPENREQIPILRLCDNLAANVSDRNSSDSTISADMAYVAPLSVDLPKKRYPVVMFNILMAVMSVFTLFLPYCI